MRPTATEPMCPGLCAMLIVPCIVPPLRPLAASQRLASTVELWRLSLTSTMSIWYCLVTTIIMRERKSSLQDCTTRRQVLILIILCGCYSLPVFNNKVTSNDYINPTSPVYAVVGTGGVSIKIS